MKIFFQTTLFFRNYPKNRTFWEVLLFQSHYTTNLLLLPIFILFIFFQKIPHFLRKKWKFWEIAIFAEKSHSTATLLSLAMLKNSCFFWKTSSSFSIKVNFGTFWELLLILSHSTANLLCLAILKNSCFFLEKQLVFR